MLAGSTTFAYDHTAAGISPGQRTSISNLEDFRLVRRRHTSVTYTLSGIDLRPLPY